MARRVPICTMSERAPHIPPELLPAMVEVSIEVPRGGFLKRAPDGHLEWASPLPCPFNYGSAPAFQGADGDPADVVVLGPRLPRGHMGRYPLVARVRFGDADVDDPKWVCSPAPATDAELLALDRFFSVYAFAKLALSRYRGEHTLSRYSGIDRVVDGHVIRAVMSGTTRARYRV